MSNYDPQQEILEAKERLTEAVSIIEIIEKFVFFHEEVRMCYSILRTQSCSPQQLQCLRGIKDRVL